MEDNCCSYTKKGCFPLFDIAYQGLGTSLVADVAPIRLFSELGLEFLVANSYAKNFGLYNTRVGSLIVIGNQPIKDIVASNVRSIIRSTYSSPPALGAEIISALIENPELFEVWKLQLEQVVLRIDSVRRSLANKLNEKGLNRVCPRLEQTKGLFALLNLPKEFIDKLQREKALYLAADGRINLAALKEEMVDQLVEALI